MSSEPCIEASRGSRARNEGWQLSARAATARRAPAAPCRTTRAQLVGERLEVQLVAQPAAERLQRLCGVVAAAVEAPVDGRLDRARAGPNSAATASVETATASPERPDGEADQQHEHQVGRAERRGQPAVDQRAVDDDVNVVEPVAQDRDAGGDRQPQHGDHARELTTVSLHRSSRTRDGDRDRYRHDRPGQGEPLHLLAPLTVGAAEPDDRRGGRADHPDHEQEHGEPHERLEQRAVDAERVVELRLVLERPGREAGGDEDTRDPRARAPGDPPPPTRQQVPVGEQQQHERAGDEDERHPRELPYQAAVSPSRREPS